MLEGSVVKTVKGGNHPDENISADLLGWHIEHDGGSGRGKMRCMLVGTILRLLRPNRRKVGSDIEGLRPMSTDVPRYNVEVKSEPAVTSLTSARNRPVLLQTPCSVKPQATSLI
jgi:hypothetical protein